MGAHKPRTARTWPEFVAEVGMIVVGVLIALGIDQAVQAWREHAQASEARQDIRLEIADNLRFLAVRAATEPCVTRRLEDIAGLMEQAERGQKIDSPIWIGRPTIYAFVDSEYRSETQTGHVSLLPGGEQAVYAAIYDSLAVYQQQEAIEQQAWANLRTLEAVPRLSDSADWQLHSAVQQARTARWAMEATAHAAETEASGLGIAPARGTRFKLQSVCVPLHTSRASALTLIARGRNNGAAFDEP